MAKINIYVESDIDWNGHGVGPDLGCTACREVAESRWGLGDMWMTRALYCGECGEAFFEAAI